MSEQNRITLFFKEENILHDLGVRQVELDIGAQKFVL